MTRFGLVFLVVLAGAAFAGLAQPRPVGRVALDGPVDRNQRLTVLAGIVLYTLPVALALTVLDARRFLGTFPRARIARGGEPGGRSRAGGGVPSLRLNFHDQHRRRLMRSLGC